MSSFLQTMGLGREASPSRRCSSSSSSRSLPLYTPHQTADGNDKDAAFSSDTRALLDDADSEDIPLTTRQFLKTAANRRHKISQRRPRRRRLPSARRFWADFTLGFADGLTVPFALTAGLSSLGGGRTDTVVKAGMAEVGAGCISMGIGGYLSARQAPAAVSGVEQGHNPGAGAPPPPSTPETVGRYLAPLALPSDLHQRVVAHVASQPLMQACMDDGDGDDDDTVDNDVWPVAAGLSVALGYLVGGLLPLGPYVATRRVSDGLRWSCAVCAAALFVFGFARAFFLGAADEVEGREWSALPPRSRRWPQRRIPWRRLCAGAGDGLQMVVLGGIAAAAAVLCVRLFGSVDEAAGTA